jgi:DNA polymerase III delta prime subunit
MIKINWFRKIPIPIFVIPLTIGILSIQALTLPFLLENSSPSILSSTFFKGAYADQSVVHGHEITLTLHNSSFGSLSSGGGNQVSVFANYELNDNSIAGQTINAVMEVYSPNGTLIRTSSYPNGFIAQNSGGVEGLETTIRDPTIQSVIANVTFRNLDKTAILSNDLRVDLNLDGGGTASTTATGEGVGVEE